MKFKHLLLIFLFFPMACTKTIVAPGDLDFGQMMQPVPKQAIFEDDEYFTWGTSPIKGDDGLYHAYYSRWKKEFGFMAWVTHSEVAHAVSNSPTGPFKFSDIALPERGELHWDGHYTHNPTIHHYEGRYYLYYAGNRGDRINVKNDLNWTHRNNQRIGVAVSDSPYGPWKRFDKPLIDVSSDSTAHDALMVANPSITKRPDGKYLMVYKAVAKKKPMPFGGPVVHLCAVSDSPEGPFEKYPDPIFTASGANFPAEDPYIWYQDNCYYAIVKDMEGDFTNKGRSLALFYSLDGFDWKPAKHTLVSELKINWEDGKSSKLSHMERPQLLIENGKPVALFLACDSTYEHSFNIQIPIK